MLERREKGRRRILQGAAQILDAGTLGDFTVDNLARNLRMSKSTLYKYFDSKDHVLVTLVEGLCSEMERALAALDLAGAPTAADALRRLVGVLAEDADRTPAAIRLQTADLPPETRERVAEVREAVRLRAVEIMSRGARSGEFDVPSPRLAAAAYLAALDEAVATTARKAGELTRGDALRAVHEMVTEGFARNLATA